MVEDPKLVDPPAESTRSRAAAADAERSACAHHPAQQPARRHLAPVDVQAEPAAVPRRGEM
jgi:hypothetical protein